VLGEHESFVHGFESSQEIVVPRHTPAEQRSVVVHASPSLHVTVLFA
jgi:hypothetical protein